MAAIFNGASSVSPGVVWSSCTLDASTFKVSPSGTQAAYKMTITFTVKSSGATVNLTKLFLLVKVSGVWKLHGVLASS